MKIGFASLPLSGHLNPMTALARRMQSRGHEVVFIGVPDVEPVALAAGLKFVSVCEKEYPAGSTAQIWGGVAKLRGADVIRYTYERLMPDFIRASLENLQQRLEETGVDAMVFDTGCRYLELVPMRMGMPYAQVWNILPYDVSGSTPLCIFSLPYETTPEARVRNLEALKTFGQFRVPLLAVAKSYAEGVGLEIDWSDPGATTSKLAVVAQTPKEFDFPNIEWPSQFHYAGPFHDNEGREPIPFPWEKLDGRPLVYASLGTLVNGLEQVYQVILEAVEKFPEIQVVLSVGKNVDPDDLGSIPANTMVVRSAPQIELLKRAELCITHAGLNTALESLAEGVPMVAIPIAYDQPGVAARIAYHGVGEFMDFEDLTAERLTSLIRTVRENPSYREKARSMQKVIARTRGLDTAAQAIEEAFQRSAAERAEAVAR